MLRLLADENFNNIIVRGVLRRNSNLNLLRVQDTEIVGADDPTLLEWAAQENRVLLTHDAATIPRFAFERVSQNLPMAGVWEINSTLMVNVAIEEILVLAECSLENEWGNQVIFLPLG